MPSFPRAREHTQALLPQGLERSVGLSGQEFAPAAKNPNPVLLAHGSRGANGTKDNTLPIGLESQRISRGKSKLIAQPLWQDDTSGLVHGECSVHATILHGIRRLENAIWNGRRRDAFGGNAADGACAR